MAYSSFAPSIPEFYGGQSHSYDAMAPAPRAGSERPRILVADDDDFVLRAITQALVASNMSVITAKNAAEVNAILAQTEVDVLVSDIGMPGNEDLQLLRVPAVASGSVRVILMTGAASVATAVIALRCGVSDYLEKPFNVAQLISGIERAMEQRRERLMLFNMQGQAGHLFPARSANDNDPLAALSPEERGALSAREREVAVLISQGLELQGIAGALCISPNTVRNHFRSIYRKLGVNSLREVVYKLLRGTPAQRR